MFLRPKYPVLLLNGLTIQDNFPYTETLGEIENI
jgi:hypothetical protein